MDLTFGHFDFDDFFRQKIFRQKIRFCVINYEEGLQLRKSDFKLGEITFRDARRSQKVSDHKFWHVGLKLNFNGFDLWTF